MYLVTAAEMQAMDRQTIDIFGLPGRILMENAGRGATQSLFRHFTDLKSKRVGIIAGSGNNAGDGFVIGRYLSQQGVDVSVYLLTEGQRIKGDAAANLALLKPLKVSVMEIPDEPAFSRHQSVMADIHVWIDAILGTGLKSEVKGYFKAVIDFINGLNKPVFAVDIPSGLNSDTGQPCGTCIRARATATFGFAKVGHFIYPGAAHTGLLEIIDIGIPPAIAETVAPKQYLITPEVVRSCLSPRPPDAHKGSTGHLLVVAGSPGKTGAAAMTSISALRSGAGLVTLGIAASLNSVLESQMMEAMTAPLPAGQNGILGQAAFDEITHLMSGKKCLAIGPGIGQAAETKRLVHQLVKTSQIPLVLDADGINHLANDVQLLRSARAPIILTPHPGEMARLLKSNVGAVQQDRITCAREFAVEFNVHVVLKGARTVIAHPDGRVYLNLSGNAGMASGGMGDVLTGVIAGLLAQGLSPESATHAAVYLHGAAADHLAKTIGPYGYLAGDVINAIPAAIKQIYDL
jgi:ADP-dependent NAD(P)H-hydrate dehydratase / NAD(P)H-hydrate epimerase